MDVPSTRPSGRKPASRTSRNSLTDKSEVKIDPALPGCSSERRLMASLGTPAALRSVLVMVFRSPLEPVRADVGARRLAALRVKRHDGQRRGPAALGGPRESGDRRPDRGGLDDVITAALSRRALPLGDPQVHVRDHDAFRAVPPDIL